MFDKSALPSDRANGELSLNQVRDGLSSLTYRIGEIEFLLNKKIDRSQCLSIVQKKVSFGQLKHGIEQLENRLKDERKEESARAEKIQEISIQKINELGKKLKELNSRRSKQDPKKPQDREQLRKILPQQLYLESNQTMFSLLIEEIYKLQEKDDQFQKQLEARNKKILSLNNEVCAKIERLQAEIEQKVKTTHEFNQSKLLGNTWSMAERTNKVTIHKGNYDSGQFESFRFDMLAKNIEALQKELLTKINMKDVLPLIKQNSQPFSESLEELREYVEQSMDSTRRILNSQTEINKEISMGVLIAWWHSFEQQHEIAIINQEVINLVPEILEVEKTPRPNCVRVLQPGIFLLKLYPIQTPEFYQHTEEEDGLDEFEIMVGTEVHIVSHESVFRLEKNKEIRLIQRCNREIVICLQKL